MLPPGLSFNAISAKALAAAKSARLPRSYWDWDDQLAISATGYFPYTPATNLLYGLHEALDMLLAEGLRQRVRAPRAAGRSDAARGARVGPRDPVREPRRIQRRADGGDDAGRPQRRRVPQDRARPLQPVARPGPGQAVGQGVPHRASRLLQRPHALRHAVRASKWAWNWPAFRTARAACWRRRITWRRRRQPGWHGRR